MRTTVYIACILHMLLKQHPFLQHVVITHYLGGIATLLLLLIAYRNSRIALICNISYTKKTARELKSSCRNERTHSQNALPDRRALQIHALCSFRVWFEIR